MVTDTDVAAWLGHVAEELPPERLDDVVSRIQAAWETIEEAMPPEEDGDAFYPDPDATEVCTGAAKYVLGDLSIPEARQAYEAARTQARVARLQLRGAVTAAVVNGDMSANKAAGLAGVAASTPAKVWGVK